MAHKLWDGFRCPRLTGQCCDRAAAFQASVTLIAATSFVWHDYCFQSRYCSRGNPLIKSLPLICSMLCLWVVNLEVHALLDRDAFLVLGLDAVVASVDVTSRDLIRPPTKSAKHSGISGIFLNQKCMNLSRISHMFGDICGWQFWGVGLPAEWWTFNGAEIVEGLCCSKYLVLTC